MKSTRGGLNQWHNNYRSICSLALQELNVGGMPLKIIPLRSFEMLQADNMKISMNNGLFQDILACSTQSRREGTAWPMTEVCPNIQG